MIDMDKVKKIYVVSFSHGYFVSKNIYTYGEEVIEHITLTKVFAEAYSFMSIDEPFPNDLLKAAQQINNTAKIECVAVILKKIDSSTSDSESAIVEYTEGLYLKNNLTIHGHLDDDTMTLELTPNINEAHQYNKRDQEICREYYAKLFANSIFYKVRFKLNDSYPIT
ncbi:hypothetical protein [Leuconostoc citreum]|uniref:hypothetical protein n=1 Tax=Leuconostoc citreum TaxID=33964 RepID=UPI0032DFE72B